MCTQLRSMCSKDSSSSGESSRVMSLSIRSSASSQRDSSRRPFGVSSVRRIRPWSGAGERSIRPFASSVPSISIIDCGVT
jgi:hypothetical protein